MVKKGDKPSTLASPQNIKQVLQKMKSNQDVEMIDMPPSRPTNISGIIAQPNSEMPEPSSPNNTSAVV